MFGCANDLLIFQIFLYAIYFSFQWDVNYSALLSWRQGLLGGRSLQWGRREERGTRLCGSERGFWGDGLTSTILGSLEGKRVAFISSYQLQQIQHCIHNQYLIIQTLSQYQHHRILLLYFSTCPQHLSKYFFISVIPLFFATPAFTPNFMSTSEYTLTSISFSFCTIRVAVSNIVPRTIPWYVSYSGMEVATLQNTWSLSLKVQRMQTKSLGWTMSIFLQARQIILVFSSTFSLQSQCQMLVSNTFWSWKLFCSSSQNSRVVGKVKVQIKIFLFSSSDAFMYIFKLYGVSGTFGYGSKLMLKMPASSPHFSDRISQQGCSLLRYWSKFFWGGSDCSRFQKFQIFYYCCWGWRWLGGRWLDLGLGIQIFLCC